MHPRETGGRSRSGSLGRLLLANPDRVFSTHWVLRASRPRLRASSRAMWLHGWQGSPCLRGRREPEPCDPSRRGTHGTESLADVLRRRPPPKALESSSSLRSTSRAPTYGFRMLPRGILESRLDPEPIGESLCNAGVRITPWRSMIPSAHQVVILVQHRLRLCAPYPQPPIHGGSTLPERRAEQSELLGSVLDRALPGSGLSLCELHKREDLAHGGSGAICAPRR
jgi:hypothetical protein